MIFLDRFFFWKNSIIFWHPKLTLKVRFWHFLTDTYTRKIILKIFPWWHVDYWPKSLLLSKVWVVTIFCVARTHLARPDLGPHAHVCAPPIWRGRTSHPHPHTYGKSKNFQLYFHNFSAIFQHFQMFLNKMDDLKQERMF